MNAVDCMVNQDNIQKLDSIEIKSKMDEVFLLKLGLPKPVNLLTGCLHQRIPAIWKVGFGARV